MHKNPSTFVQSWVLQHVEDFFFFQKVGEINGIQVPITIGINVNQCFHVATKVLFQWMSHLGPI